MHRILAYIVVGFAALCSGCASLPPLEGRSETTAFADTQGTRLGHAIAADVAANPGKTGVHAFQDPRDAAAARILLAAAAEKSLDVQYYIWHADEVGYLLFEALWQAAERGVRVRLLLDDLNTKGLDGTIAVLDQHPNIEVRLYNPVMQRSARVLNFITDFSRVNRRMHNKSFTADNQASVVGGRNIGNEYFGVGSGVVFTDLDVLAVGEGVKEVSREFDLYWNSASAYPAASFVEKAGPHATEELKDKFTSTRADRDSVVYLEAVRRTPLVRDIIEHKFAFEWTTTKLVYDDPAKTLDTGQRTDILLFPELVRTIGRPETALDLVSPYFVPGDEGTSALVALAHSGVKVRILTNSLSSSDVAAVHAGYAKRRRDLLEAGVQLYELKATGVRDSESVSELTSSSSSGLHAKTFAVDRRRIFVGSFNFDPRSARINTEMGFVIDSPTFAQQLAHYFDTTVPMVAYEVRLMPDGQSLEWIDRSAAGETRYTTEPGTTWFQRSKIGVLSIFPIDWLL
jgi:putative cardiolipin synthase